MLRPPPYRTLEAFAPVSLVATGPLALVAHQFAPYASYADVVRAARREPGAVRYASSGVGGLAHLAATLLQQAGGYRLAHVPYPGGGPAAADAVAGRVPLLMSNVVAVREHVRSGALRPLGVTTREETRHLPGVRPFAQQGMPGGFEALTWWALLGVAGTPEPLLARMGEAVRGALAGRRSGRGSRSAGPTWWRPRPRSAPPSWRPRSSAGGGWSATTTSRPTSAAPPGKQGRQTKRPGRCGGALGGAGGVDCGPAPARRRVHVSSSPTAAVIGSPR